MLLNKLEDMWICLNKMESGFFLEAFITSTFTYLGWSTMFNRILIAALTTFFLSVIVPTALAYSQNTAEEVPENIRSTSVWKGLDEGYVRFQFRQEWRLLNQSKNIYSSMLTDVNSRCDISQADKNIASLEFNELFAQYVAGRFWARSSKQKSIAGYDNAILLPLVSLGTEGYPFPGIEMDFEGCDPTMKFLKGEKGEFERAIKVVVSLPEQMSGSDYRKLLFEGHMSLQTASVMDRLLNEAMLATIRTAALHAYFSAKPEDMVKLMDVLREVVSKTESTFDLGALNRASSAALALIQGRHKPQ